MASDHTGSPLLLCNTISSFMMSYVGDAYRFFTSFRMTHLRFVVILSEAKDLCESNTINIIFEVTGNNMHAAALPPPMGEGDREAVEGVDCSLFPVLSL